MSIPIKSLAGALIDPNNQSITGFTDKQIFQALHEHGVAELAYNNFKHLSGLNDALSVRAKTSIATEMARAHELGLLISAFNEKKTPLLIFKGTALAYRSYKNPWQRPRGDTDVLIDRTQLKQIRSIFKELGYKEAVAVSGKYISYQTSFTKVVTPDFIHTLDVHWRINNRQILSNCYDLISINGKPANTPCRIDSILLAAIHRKGHHAETERLIWLYDIHVVSESLSEKQWLELAAKARSKKIAALTLNALEMTHELLDTKIPRVVFKTLKHESVKDEVSKVFLNEKKSELAVFWTDMKHGLPDWSSRLTLLKEHIIPSKDYLEHKSQGNSVFITFIKRVFSGVSKKLR